MAWSDDLVNAVVGMWLADCFAVVDCDIAACPKEQARAAVGINVLPRQRKMEKHYAAWRHLFLLLCLHAATLFGPLDMHALQLLYVVMPTSKPVLIAQSSEAAGCQSMTAKEMIFMISNNCVVRSFELVSDRIESRANGI